MRRGRGWGKAMVIAVVALVLASTGVTSAVGAEGDPLAETSPPTGFTGPDPIVFLHGWNSDNGAWNTMRARFEAEGYPADRLSAFGYDTGQSSTITAGQLGTHITALLATTGASEVDIVGHSLGSLSSRWCIAFGTCADVVDDYVSLGGPNHGTTWALFCFWSDACRDMQPGSGLLDTLNEGDETPGDQVTWTTVRTPCDLVIVPSESTELEGALNQEVDCMDHGDLRTDLAVHALVRAAVFEPDPPPVPVAPGPPTIVDAVPGDGQVTLTWQAPASDGGSAITGYRLAVDGDVVQQPTGTTATVGGLTNGTTYAFTVAATNGVGTGPMSDAVSVAPVEPPPPPFFPDVRPDHRFYEEVQWAAANGIVTGYADGRFHSRYRITRQATAAFLFRLAGSPPAVPPTTPTFTDVPTSHPFVEEIEWMVAEGIATGYPDGRFRPGAEVTRQATATFLHRLSGAPIFPLPPAPTFTDVPLHHPFALEIEWASALGITTGFDDGTFGPATPITRAAMAAFLFRFDQAGLTAV